MGREQQSRPLEFSDIVSGQHAAILADPYGFLGLPPNAPLDVVRGVYIAKAKLYHPDMISPTLPSIDVMNQRLMESGTSLTDILGQPSSLGPDATEEEKEMELRERFAAAAGVTVQDLDNQANALRAMQELAHTRMVELNTAYEAIRLKLNPKQREMLAGYRIRNMIGEDGPYQEIDLEGQGKVVIVPTGREDTDKEYAIPGPYLHFDWAPPRDHRWMTWEMGFSEVEFVNHLFVHHELQEGREQISPVLLEPFFQTLGVEEDQREVFMRMLMDEEDTKDMLDALGMRQARDISIDLSRDGNSLSPEWFRSLSFEQYANGMMYLNHYKPHWGQPYMPQIRIEDGKLKLKAYTETVLSETDTILLQTMAYGPMLRGE